MKEKLPSLSAGFTENNTIQHCLITMLEEWEKTDNGMIFGSIFMDLSKAFDTINHDCIKIQI